MAEHWQRPLWFDLTIGPALGAASCLLIWAIVGAELPGIIYLVAFLIPAIGCTAAFLKQRRSSGRGEQIELTPRNKAIAITWMVLNLVLAMALWLVPFDSVWQKVIVTALSLNTLTPRLLLSKEPAAGPP